MNIVDVNKEIKIQEYRNFKIMMDITQNNYANMIKRLSLENKFSKYTLIYYSIFLIISSLTVKFFPNIYNGYLNEYFSIVLSVIVLAYSLINNAANYDIRINALEYSMNKIKNLKRDLNSDNIEDTKEKYNQITDTTEMRLDIDFFVTIKQFSKRYGIDLINKKYNNNNNNEESSSESKLWQEKIINYLSEINILKEKFKQIYIWIFKILLSILPIVIFIICLIL